MRSLLHLLALASALVQQADECSKDIGPQESIVNTDEAVQNVGVLDAENVIEHHAASFLNETGAFGPPAVVKAGLLAKWKGKMVIGRKLGAGAFGTAFQATLKSPCPAEHVVIKIQNAQGSVQSWMKEIIMPEISAMKTISNLPEGKEYFVGLLGEGKGPAQNQFSMLLELANQGMLTGMMFPKHSLGGKLPDMTIGQMLHQMLTGLKVLAGLNIVHRDLKPDNVLVVEAGGQMHAKIADFGLACIAKAKSWSHCGLGGTPIYMAPEVFMRPAVIAPSNDVWAIGVMAYQFLHPGAVVLPFINKRGWKPQDLARAPGPDSYVHGSGPLVQLTKMLLQPKPSNRWKVEQALQHLETHGFSSPAPPSYALPPCFEQMEPEPEPEPVAPKPAAPKPAAPKPAVARPAAPKPAAPKRPAAQPAPKRVAKPPAADKPAEPKPAAAAAVAAAAPKAKVKVQIPEDASAGELVTFIYNGRERDASLPDDVKKGEEVEIDAPEDEAEHVEQVVLKAGADQMQATALTKILEGKNVKGNAIVQYLPAKLRNMDWTIVDIGNMPPELFMGNSEDAAANREKLQNGDFGRAIIMNVQFHA